jgi:hypothetical protein
MLKARWKGNAPAPSAQPEPLAEGQIRTFKIIKLDAAGKKIEVELTAGYSGSTIAACRSNNS